MNNRIFKALLLLFCMQQGANVEAQVMALTRNYNSIRDGDILVKKQIPFVSPIDGTGKNIWHFSNDGRMAKEYKVAYEIANDSILSVENGTCYFMQSIEDSIYMMGYENKTTQIQYSQPRLEIKYPLTIGDSLSSTFEGTGVYCGKIHLSVRGRNTIVADQLGMLTNGVDTFLNVLLVHKQIGMIQRKMNEIVPYAYTDAIDSDTTSGEMKHIVEDHYLWYGEGWRYPILESVESHAFQDGVKKRIFGTSFLYLPDWQEMDLPFDSENNWVRFQQNVKDGMADNGMSQQEIEFPVSMSASYDKVSQRLVLEYSQREQGVLKVIACDAFARPLGSSSYEHSAGAYKHILQLGNRPSSNVLVLHMEINGNKHSIKIK